MKTIVVSITALLALAIVLGYQACRETVRLAERFQSDKITLTFRSSLEKAISTQGDVLERAHDRFLHALRARQSFLAALALRRSFQKLSKRRLE